LFQVRSCGGGYDPGLAGATVALSGQAANVAGVTDANGYVTLTGIKGNCPMTVTVSKPHWTTKAYNDVATPCNDTTSYGWYTNLNMDPAPGFICLPSCCINPLKLFIQDALGIHPWTVGWTEGANNGGWTDCLIKGGVNAYSAMAGSYCGGVLGPQSVAYRYELACLYNGGSPIWRLTRLVVSCMQTPSGIYAPIASGCVNNIPTGPNGSGVIGESFSQPSPLGSCGPLELTFNFTYGWGDSAIVRSE
jgi:hypothetical protein